MRASLSLSWIVLAFAGCAKGQTAPDGGLADTAVVSISPATPHAGDDLHAVVSNPSSESYTFRWSVDGTARPELTGLDVSADLTHRDQHWQVDLESGAAVVSTATVTILDTTPGAPSVAVTTLPCAGEAIQCVVTTPSADRDGDSITYTATWTKNGLPYTGAVQTVFPGDTVPAADSGTIGDSFVCTVTASDGAATATATSSAAVTVAAGPVTFGFTGATQMYAVPDCVKHVTIGAWGAQGSSGDPSNAPGAGGLGGYAQGNLDVSPGMILVVEVGGQNGYNGGGAGSSLTPSAAANGGGASDVRVGGVELVNRVIVAGGGGGGGVGDAPGHYAGGAGGGGTCGSSYCGGAGGAGYSYPSSGNGAPGGAVGGAAVTAPHAGGGGGGGMTSGGSASCETYDAPSRCATAGTLGQGGAGDPGGAALHSGYCYAQAPAGAGGTAGGGGGFYGGGGASVGWCGGGGGGGGTSWVGSLSAPTMTGGVRAGDGQVTITPY